MVVNEQLLYETREVVKYLVQQVKEANIEASVTVYFSEMPSIDISIKPCDV